MLGANRFLSAGANFTITPIFAPSLALIAAAGTPHYATLSALLALMVGVFLLGAGFFRAGWVANLLSIPVLTGFLARHRRAYRGIAGAVLPRPARRFGHDL